MGALGSSRSIRPGLLRRLRINAFDPTLSTRIDTAEMNHVVAAVPWEDGLQPGPVGEYLEVLDRDPASDCWYEPVDLNSAELLATDGLSPSESNPQFHQQMVYAVAMTTIRSFERALGRVAMWSDKRERDKQQNLSTKFVKRLRIYPHGIRERNAYYSPTKKALVFGYFPSPGGATAAPKGTLVFTCLSHDIVAHEVTHALLDGVHPRFNMPTNHDVLAFHEAFSDIVALFQHFTYPGVVLSQIRRSAGTLATENLLSQLAQQFGQTTGRGAALRDALGSTDPETGVWKPQAPDPTLLARQRGAHARGSILVAAVFRAFLKIYRHRTADLLRIATGGTGRLPEGEMHPDLAKRLAQEAAATADRVLQMCIRALDYCPPVDITFGDYLRAVVTADLDFAPNEEDSYRLVFVESFREWGIHPEGVTTLGVEALAWPSLQEILEDEAARMTRGAQGKNPAMNGILEQAAVIQQHLRERFLTGVAAKLSWTLESDRKAVWDNLSAVAKDLWHWIQDGDSAGAAFSRLLGLTIRDYDLPARAGAATPAPPRWPLWGSIYRSSRSDGPTLEIHSVRPALRRTSSGAYRTDLVVEATQRRMGFFDPKTQSLVDDGLKEAPKNGDFTFRAGCTVLIDPATGEVRRVMRTRGDIADDAALDRVRRHLLGGLDSPTNAFDEGMRWRDKETREEPFAMVHKEEN